MSKARKAMGHYYGAMGTATILPLAYPGLAAVRVANNAPHIGIKEYYAVARTESGRSRYWAQGKIWDNGPGAIALKQPGHIHRDLKIDGTVVLQIIALPMKEMDAVRAHGHLSAPSHLEPGDERATAFHRLHDAVSASADRLTLEVAVTEAVAAFASITAQSPAFPQRIRRAMAFLQEHLTDEVTLDELAAHTGLDKFHLCRAFRAQVGIPPYAYLTHLRIARAKDLLLSGVPASEVAPQVGLYDQSQLTRHFRRIVGVTPARFCA